MNQNLMTQTLSLAEQAAPFLQDVETRLGDLRPMPWRKASVNPAKTAIFSVDVTNGFCYAGPLASPRVAGIVEPITHLLKQGWALGVQKIVLIQDTHDAEAVEFAQFPPHCVRGSVEAETVDAFKHLPFYKQMTCLEKNSIDSAMNTGLNRWLNDHPEVDTFIVVGDCTDLCIYQLAMHLRLDANARQLKRRVIVPANCTQTYDRPVEVAQEQGGLPHDGDLMHAIFLYHMLLNGIEIPSKIS